MNLIKPNTLLTSLLQWVDLVITIAKLDPILIRSTIGWIKYRVNEN